MTNNRAALTWKGISQSLGILPVLLLFAIAFSLITPSFLTFNNIMNIFRTVSINLVIATGMTLVILTGGIDLSVGSIVAVTGVFALKVAIAATILGGTSFTGGKGNVVGTLFGVLIIGVLNNGLTIAGVSYFWQQVVKGVVIILAVVIDVMRNKLNR